MWSPAPRRPCRSRSSPTCPSPRWPARRSRPPRPGRATLSPWPGSRGARSGRWRHGDGRGPCRCGVRNRGHVDSPVIAGCGKGAGQSRYRPAGRGGATRRPAPSRARWVTRCRCVSRGARRQLALVTGVVLTPLLLVPLALVLVRLVLVGLVLVRSASPAAVSTCSVAALLLVRLVLVGLFSLAPRRQLPCRPARSPRSFSSASFSSASFSSASFSRLSDRESFKHPTVVHRVGGRRRRGSFRRHAAGGDHREGDECRQRQA